MSKQQRWTQAGIKHEQARKARKAARRLEQRERSIRHLQHEGRRHPV